MPQTAHTMAKTTSYEASGRASKNQEPTTPATWRASKPARGLPLVDLRLICDRDEDYANPIEPSARGGDKIAAAVARLVAEHDFARRRSEVFAG